MFQALISAREPGFRFFQTAKNPFPETDTPYVAPAGRSRPQSGIRNTRFRAIYIMYKRIFRVRGSPVCRKRPNYESIKNHKSRFDTNHPAAAVSIIVPRVSLFIHITRIPLPRSPSCRCCCCYYYYYRYCCYLLLLLLLYYYRR